MVQGFFRVSACTEKEKVHTVKIEKYAELNPILTFTQKVLMA